jgi:purine nucleosidase
MTPARPVIIDTDPGIDDALAILLALASPEIELRALTTVAGNVGLERTTENALKLCALGGRPDLPVHAGSAAPLRRDARVATVHGTSGMDGAELPRPRAKPHAQPAIDWLAEALGEAQPGSQTLVAIGPLTNVAAALARAPGIGASLRELVIMGGATPTAGGNVSAHAEYNIFVDPEAAAVVFGSDLPITLVPLDLSYQMKTTPARIDRFAAIGGPVAAAVAGMLRHFSKGDGHLHDPLTVAYLLRPELFAGERARVAIETSGPSDGETRFDWRTDGNCQVLLKGDADGFFDLLTERFARLKPAVEPL